MGFTSENVNKALRLKSGDMMLALEYLLDESNNISSTAVSNPITHISTALSNNNNIELTELELSQYSLGGGSSACTSIAFFTMMEILNNLNKGKEINNKNFLTEAILSGLQAHLSTSSSSSINKEHLTIEEVWESESSIQLRDTLSIVTNNEQDLLTNGHVFERLFDKIRNTGDNSLMYRGAIIIKPPETISIIIPTINNTNGIYLLFDSHSRPELGINGAYLAVSDNYKEIINRIKIIFKPFIDTEGDGNNYLMQMYNMFEYSSFELNRKVLNENYQQKVQQQQEILLDLDIKNLPLPPSRVAPIDNAIDISTGLNSSNGNNEDNEDEDGDYVLVRDSL